MECNVIATGSTGNAVLINKIILIDCGVSWRRIKDYAKDIKLVLLTHIHGDHYNSRTVSKLAFERPMVRFGCMPWMLENLRESNVQKHNIDIYQNCVKNDYGAFQVEPVIIPHDVPNCGYKLFIGGEKIFYATDCGSLSHVKAKNYDYYLIEANYTKEELSERIKRKLASGAYIHEYRVERQHMAEEDSMNWILDNAGQDSKYMFLHKHKEKKNDKQTNN